MSWFPMAKLCKFEIGPSLEPKCKFFSTTCASKSQCKIHQILTTLEHGIGKQYWKPYKMNHSKSFWKVAGQFW
jgi:hypothetical protein